MKKLSLWSPCRYSGDHFRLTTLSISIVIKLLYTKNLQFVEHGKVWPKSITREVFLHICLGKWYSNLPAGVVAGPLLKKVGCDFVRVQNEMCLKL